MLARSALVIRPLAAAGLLAAAAGLGACGPRKSDSTTIDAITIQRGVVVGGPKDVPPGTRALNAGVPKNLGQLEGEVHDTLFGDGGKVKLTGYLNGIKPDGGTKERAYPGDRTGWLVRDVSDPAAVPEAVVGLFPAPFNTRFTPKRRLMPTRVQCVDGGANGCRAVVDALARAGVRTGVSSLQDATTTTALRIYVGPWAALRPTLAKGRLAPALDIEQQAETNGFGVQLTPDGKTVQVGATFGEASDSPAYSGGTGVIFADRDVIGSPFWVVTGTDENGVTRAAEKLDENDLIGRVAAVVPPS